MHLAGLSPTLFGRSSVKVVWRAFALSSCSLGRLSWPLPGPFGRLDRYANCPRYIPFKRSSVGMINVSCEVVRTALNARGNTDSERRESTRKLGSYPNSWTALERVRQAKIRPSTQGMRSAARERFEQAAARKASLASSELAPSCGVREQSWMPRPTSLSRSTTIACGSAAWN